MAGRRIVHCWLDVMRQKITPHIGLVELSALLNRYASTGEHHGILALHSSCIHRAGTANVPQVPAATEGPHVYRVELPLVDSRRRTSIC